MYIRTYAPVHTFFLLIKYCWNRIAPFDSTGCAVTPCSKQIFLQIFSIILLFHNSKPGKWFLLIG